MQQLVDMNIAQVPNLLGQSSTYTLSSAGSGRVVATGWQRENRQTASLATFRKSIESYISWCVAQDDRYKTSRY